MDKVTVLMAAYNAGEFIARGLDSLARQTHTDIEVICIDDASTDNTPDILDGYAARDCRFHTIHLPENGGQAHARNAGLAVATGEYVCMLDADDWLSPNAIELAVAEFHKCGDTDCVLFDVVMEHGTRSEHYPMPDFTTLHGEEAFRLSLTWRIHGIYMTRAEIHKRYPYDESCRLYSDDNTTRLHYLASRKVGRCGGQYHYLQHGQSATHAVSAKRFDRLRADVSMKKQMETMGVDNEVIAGYESQRWLNLIDAYMFYHCHGKELTPNERAFGMAEMEKAWRDIDRAALPTSLSRKPGHWPMPTWRLFLMQEWAYFTLRDAFGRNR